MNSGRWAGAIGLAVVLCVRVAAAACQGDCSGDGEVTVNEIVLGVNIANGGAQLIQCTSFDVNSDGQVTINELIGAVTNALNGCNAPAPTPTPTPSSGGPLPTRPPRPTPAKDCAGGYVAATFSNASGTNTFTQPLNGTVGLTNVSGTVTSGLVRGFGSNAIFCPLSINTTVRRFAVVITGLPHEGAGGQTYQLQRDYNFSDPTRPTVAWLDYFEVRPTDPLNNRGWRADRGTLTIDAIDGDTVYFHAEADMSPQTSVTPAGTAAQGTFHVELIGTIDAVQRASAG